MRLFGRKLGASRTLGKARAAELRGELGQAAALFAQAGRLDEASRVMLLRGDGEMDPAARLRHYVQALATAPAGSDAHTHARRKHAMLVLAIATGETVTPALRQDLLQAGRDLEAIGEPEKAAEAYARGGDVEGEARGLGQVAALRGSAQGQPQRSGSSPSPRGTTPRNPS